MDRASFDEYVRRFNAEDPTAFDEFLAAGVTVQNGGLHFSGRQGMKDHYAKIWGRLKETLRVQRFVCDGDTLAVHLHTHFEALVDDGHTLFGSIRKGECFDYDGIVMYRLDGGLLADIKVSYLSFIKTDLNGIQHSLGLVH